MVRCIFLRSLTGLTCKTSEKVCMFWGSELNQSNRLWLGTSLLIAVNLIWAISSDVTKYLLKEETFQRPYFTTYIRLSMLTVYLFGFLLFKTWRLQFKKHEVAPASPEHEKYKAEELLSMPTYVPVNFVQNGYDTSDVESENDTSAKSCRTVRFNKVTEVREISGIFGEDDVMARLSFAAYKRMKEENQRRYARMSVKQVAKSAFFFCIMFFFGQFAYMEAMKFSDARIVNIFTSTGEIMTLLLAGSFPSCRNDKFTISKLVSVLLSMIGIFLVCTSGVKLDMNMLLSQQSLWAFGCAAFYTSCLVMLRRRVDREDKLNIPMFFGFVGFFVALFLWPGILIGHFSKTEIFSWPSRDQWMLLLVNGVICTVLSQLLWIWALFLTSSLTATISLTLMIPLTMVSDFARGTVSFDWRFYVGVGPIIFAFIAITLMNHWDNWDPLCTLLRRLCVKVHKTFARCCLKGSWDEHARRHGWSQENSEQLESLILSDDKNV